MTVSSDQSSETFSCDGSTTVFTCPFRVLATAELRGYLITISSGASSELTNGTDFTVSGVDDANCVATTATAYSSLYQVRFKRVTERLQPTDYRAGDAFPAESHERALDRLTHIAQELDAGTTPNDASDLAVRLASDSSAEDGAGMVGYSSAISYPAGTIGAAVGRQVWAEDFGLSPAGTPAENAAALLLAIAALRGAAVTLSTDGLGSGSLTVYSSGVLNIGDGVFEIAPDVIDLTQDVGLVIRGQGSRRFTNYVRGRTVLLVSGTSSGFGIRTKGNGARGLVLEDLDLSYKTSAFTGDLLDCYSTPGVTLNRATLCSYGITAGTRLQTARSNVRLTYDEFFSANDAAFDGAVDGIWSDDTREPSVSFSQFGGSQTNLRNCAFYDFTGRMIRHDGNRTRNGLTISTGTFNPISLDCTRCVDLNNVEAFVMTGSAFSPSAANKATSEWMRLVNCTGSINGNAFDDLSAAGTVDGKLDISNNRFASTAGLTLMGGIITGQGNEFSAGTYGWRVTAPTYQLTLKLGPDEFKAAVTASYSLGASQTSVKGRITYDPDYDASTNKWSCSNPRISFTSSDDETASQSADYTTTRLTSGRTQELTKSGSTQAVTLHTPSGAREIQRFFKTTGQIATVTCAGSTFYYTGGTTTTSIATWAANIVGGYLELESYGTVGWKVIRSSGVTFS